MRVPRVGAQHKPATSEEHEINTPCWPGRKLPAGARGNRSHSAGGSGRRQLRGEAPHGQAATSDTGAEPLARVIHGPGRRGWEGAPLPASVPLGTPGRGRGACGDEGSRLTPRTKGALVLAPASSGGRTATCAGLSRLSRSQGRRRSLPARGQSAGASRPDASSDLPELGFTCARWLVRK